MIDCYAEKKNHIIECPINTMLIKPLLNGKTLVLRPDGPFFSEKSQNYMYDTLKVILFVFIESRTGLLL